MELIQNNSSLLHRIYKTRYFSHTPFFESKLKQSPSYAWKGIWEVKKWIHKGCLWRIGDGTTLKLWKDPWLYTKDVILTPPVELELDPNLDTVSMLIDSQTKRSDFQLVYSLFDPVVAATILKIPLSQDQHIYRWIWRKEKNGNFSVKSAYQLFQKIQTQRNGECSSAHTFDPLWKTI